MKRLLKLLLPLGLTLLLLAGCGAETQTLPEQTETTGTRAVEETPRPSETVSPTAEEGVPDPAANTTESESCKQKSSSKLKKLCKISGTENSTTKPAAEESYRQPK